MVDQRPHQVGTVLLGQHHVGRRPMQEDRGQRFRSVEDHRNLVAIVHEMFGRHTLCAGAIAVEDTFDLPAEIVVADFFNLHHVARAVSGDGANEAIAMIPCIFHGRVPVAISTLRVRLPSASYSKLKAPSERTRLLLLTAKPAPTGLPFSSYAKDSSPWNE
jgi:hypothetical protein